MVSERLKILFGKVKERLGEFKPEDIAKFATKEAAGAIPIVGQIIKYAFDEFSEDEKEELIKELKELSESQFKEISEKVGVSVEYLKDIQKFTLYTFKELRADHEEIKELILRLLKIQTSEVKSNNDYYRRKEFERELLHDWASYEAKRRHNIRIILAITMILIILMIIWRLYGIL
jgi:hypothetical protein